MVGPLSTPRTNPLSSWYGITEQASTDDQLLSLWLHGRAKATQDAYTLESRRFLGFVSKPLRSVTIGDVQAYITSLEHLAPATQNRALAAIKSLMGFGLRVGYLPFNVAEPVRSPRIKKTIAERILTETQMLSMIALTTNRRDRSLLRLMYATGARVSEICSLRWRDLQESLEGRGQVTLFGKGGKTRVVVFSAETWREVQVLQGEGGLDTPVFRSRKGGGPISRSQVKRIVEAAGKRAGVPGKVSPHWLRHSHATHALERGTPIQLVQATLAHASVGTTGMYLHVRPQDSSGLHLAV